MTTLSFDIFARNHSSKEFDRLSKDLKKSVKDFDNFGNRAVVSFAKTANSLSNIPVAAAGIVSVGQTISGLSGLLGLLPAAAAAAGAGFATLAVGVSGFADGLKELADSGKIQKAATGAADASVAAARRIESAEQSLARAQQNSEDAQVSLTRARKTATEQLEDLRLALRGAALGEEEALLGLQQAQQRLAETRIDPEATGLDLRDAELGVQRAALAVDEAKEHYGDLREESAAAAKAGVEGSDEVVAAQRQVADAAQGVRDAQREVAQAHEDAARSASNATAALGGSTEAFNKLSANAQDTVRAITGLGGAWSGLKNSVQDALFAGIADQVKKLGGTYIPVLKQGMTGIAGEFNKGAKSLGDFLAEGRQADSIRTIFGGSKVAAGQFAQALKPLVSILLDVAAVGSEMLSGTTGGFVKAAESAAAFVKNARETGALREWMQKGIDTLKKLGELFGNIGGIIGAVFSGFNAGGKNFLDTMIEMTGKIEDFLRSVEGQSALKALGEALAAVSKVVTEVLIAAFKELAPIIVKIAPGFADMAHMIGSVLVDAIEFLGPLLVGLAGFISDNIGWLGPLALALLAGVAAFKAVTIAVAAFNVVMALNPWVAIIAATIALVILIATHWDQVMKVVSAAFDWILNTARTTWEHIKSAIVDPIVDAAQWIGRLVGDIIGWFASLPRKIGDALGSLGNFIGDAFKWGLNKAIDFLNWGIDRINDLIYGVNVLNPFEDIPYIPHVPKLHSGGMVPGVPGSESLFMLEAGETVLPADWQPATAPSIPRPPRIPVSAPPMSGEGNGTRGGEWRVRGTGALAELIQRMFDTGEIEPVFR